MFGELCLFLCSHAHISYLDTSVSISELDLFSLSDDAPWFRRHDYPVVLDHFERAAEFVALEGPGLQKDACIVGGFSGGFSARTCKFGPG